MKYTFRLVALLLIVPLYIISTQKKKEEIMKTEITEVTPQYLYKILSLENWQASQGKTHLVLSSDDDAFIHFSKEDQFDRILKKYWNDTPYVLLKIKTSDLEGAIVFEANRSGSEKYYHLYNGKIPVNAVVEHQFGNSTTPTPKEYSDQQ